MADVKNYTWKDRKGKQHLLKDMDDSYLKNCIKTLEQNQNTQKPVYTHLKEELESRQPKTKKKFKFIAKD